MTTPREEEIEIGSDEWWERQLAADRLYYFFRDLERRFGLAPKRTRLSSSPGFPSHEGP